MTAKLDPVFIDEGDAEIDRIREARHQISEQFGHDPYRLVAHYIELQKHHPEKMVAPPVKIAKKYRET